MLYFKGYTITLASAFFPQLGIMRIFTTELFVPALNVPQLEIYLQHKKMLIVQKAKSGLYVHLILYYTTHDDLYRLSSGSTATDITLAKVCNYYKVQ